MKQIDAMQEKNLRNIYRLIYEERGISRKKICDVLGMCRPTACNYLEQLESEGRIYREGVFRSTGGRPAAIYRCVPDARLAVGLEMTAERVRIAVVDLYGKILREETMDMPFQKKKTYFRRINERIHHLLGQVADDGNNRRGRSPGGGSSQLGRIPGGEDRLLGVMAAVQGVLAPDGSKVIFSGLLDNAELTIEDFRESFDFPVKMVHDAEAAAFAEMKRTGLLAPEMERRFRTQAARTPVETRKQKIDEEQEQGNYLYLSLNPSLGSAMIRKGRLHTSNGFGAGVAEHMILFPEGETCYCGNRGCADTRLRAQNLEEKSELTIPAFFGVLRTEDGRTVEDVADPFEVIQMKLGGMSDAEIKEMLEPEGVSTEQEQALYQKCRKIWDQYLEDLARLIYNIRLLGMGDVILGGVLEPYLTKDDLEKIQEHIRGYGRLGQIPFRLERGRCGASAAVVGAGLLLVEEYLAEA